VHSFYEFIHLSIALQSSLGPWPFLQFSNRKAATYTENNTNTNIHALSGLRTHDPSAQASEDSSCLRQRGHCNRPDFMNMLNNKKQHVNFLNLVHHAYTWASQCFIRTMSSKLLVLLDLMLFH
jgi:hypothetical protein